MCSLVIPRVGDHLEDCLTILPLDFLDFDTLKRDFSLLNVPKMYWDRISRAMLFAKHELCKTMSFLANNFLERRRLAPSSKHLVRTAAAV